MATLRSEAELKQLRSDGTKESVIERHFMLRAKQYGCKQRKLTQFYAEEGWPDRLLVWEVGITDYIELKRPKGGKLEPRQKTVIKDLLALNCTVETLATKEAIDTYFRDRAAELRVKPKVSLTKTRKSGVLLSAAEFHSRR